MASPRPAVAGPYAGPRSREGRIVRGRTIASSASANCLDREDGAEGFFLKKSLSWWNRRLVMTVGSKKIWAEVRTRRMAAAEKRGPPTADGRLPTRSTMRLKTWSGRIMGPTSVLGSLPGARGAS